MRYCERCRDFHNDNELCPIYKEQLRKNPGWLAEAADFASVAAQNQLVSTQALDHVARAVNKVVGTDFAYEGTRQAARDIQVFAKLNSDSFSRSGQFANSRVAQETLKNADEGFKRYLKGRLNGTGQEVDWLRSEQGKISSLFRKSTLPDGNTVGYDGLTVNRFTGKVVERTSIKAAESGTGIYTNARDVVEAIEKGTLNVKDTVVGVDGTKEAVLKALEKKIQFATENGDAELVKKLTAAKDNLKINEMSNTDKVIESTKRLTKKIEAGKANINITPELVGQKMAQGAVIGAAVSLTISGITNFIRYKNGEITKAEAFRDVGEDSVKGLLTGAAMGGITLFLPGGPIGFIAGMAIGIYIGEVCGNVLDEVFGKGAYEQILHACGYVAGTAKNLGDMLEKYRENIRKIDANKEKIKVTRTDTNKKLNSAESYLALAGKMLEEI